jgi:hypothetical protein
MESDFLGMALPGKQAFRLDLGDRVFRAGSPWPAQTGSPSFGLLFQAESGVKRRQLLALIKLNSSEFRRCQSKYASRRMGESGGESAPGTATVGHVVIRRHT